MKIGGDYPNHHSTPFRRGPQCFSDFCLCQYYFSMPVYFFSWNSIYLPIYISVWYISFCLSRRRSTTQFELGNYKLTSGGEDGENEEDGAAPLSPQKLEYQKKMSRNLNGGCDLADAKILSYATKPPSAPEGYQSQLRVLYSQSKVGFESTYLRRFSWASHSVLFFGVILSLLCLYSFCLYSVWVNGEILMHFAISLYHRRLRPKTRSPTDTFPPCRSVFWMRPTSSTITTWISSTGKTKTDDRVRRWSSLAANSLPVQMDFRSWLAFSVDDISGLGQTFSPWPWVMPSTLGMPIREPSICWWNPPMNTKMDIQGNSHFCIMTMYLLHLYGWRWRLLKSNHWFAPEQCNLLVRRRKFSCHWDFVEWGGNLGREPKEEIENNGR